MEITATFVREGDADAAIAMYQRIKQKMRAGVSGYGCVDAGRLCFQIAALQSQPDTAARYYEEATGTNGADSSLTAEAYLRAAAWYRVAGIRERERAMYEAKRDLPLPAARQYAEMPLRQLARREPGPPPADRHLGRAERS